jgi:hypothetical protein
MSKNKEINDIELDEKKEIDFEIIEEAVEVEDDVVELSDETEEPLFVRVKVSANLRMYPHHNSKLIRRLRDKTEHEVLDIAKGSLVNLTNVWYEVKGGYVHASQVELM